MALFQKEKTKMAAPADDPETEICPTLPAVTASSTTEIQCKTVSTEVNNADDHKDASNVESTAAKEEKSGIYASYQHSSCLRRIKFAFQRRTYFCSSKAYFF